MCPQRPSDPIKCKVMPLINTLNLLVFCNLSRIELQITLAIGLALARTTGVSPFLLPGIFLSPKINVHRIKCHAVIRLFQIVGGM